MPMMAELHPTPVIPRSRPRWPGMLGKQMVVPSTSSQGPLPEHRLTPVCYFKAIGALVEPLNVTRSRVGEGGQSLQN